MRRAPLTVLLSCRVAFAASLLGTGCGGSSSDSAPDATPPTAPTLSVVSTTSSSIGLGWSGATDDRGVASYRLYRGGTAYQEVAGTSYTDAGLPATTRYCYRVLALDAAGNESPLSSEQCATTGAPGTMSLNVTKAGTGSGTVTSSPTGINCGGSCAATYSPGTSVTLSPSPLSGSNFVSWSGCSSTSGNTCTVVMNANRTVIATFNLVVPTYTLTVTKVGAGSGTVTSSPTGITCGSTCSAQFNAVSQVTLIPSANAESRFATWSGCNSVSGATCTVAMNANRSVTATFSLSGPQTRTLPLLASNCVLSNSLDSAVENTVYPNCAPSVGLNRYWSGVGSYPNRLAAASLAKWDTSELVGATIDEAHLGLEVQIMWAGYAPKNFQVGAVKSSWTPGTVTWHLVTGFTYWDSSWLTYLYPTYVGETYDINLGTIVQNWANGSWSNNGIQLQSVSYLENYNENSLDAYTFWLPTLTVTYH
jgi:hypothetical protein